MSPPPPQFASLRGIIVSIVLILPPRVLSRPDIFSGISYFIYYISYFASHSLSSQTTLPARFGYGSSPHRTAAPRTARRVPPRQAPSAGRGRSRLPECLRWQRGGLLYDHVHSHCNFLPICQPLHGQSSFVRSFFPHTEHRNSFVPSMLV